MTCPENLIIDSIPGEIKVPLGKNITGIEIYLKKGASISGRILDADGITPIKGARISRDTWIDGKMEYVYTDEYGRFTITGLEGGEKMVFVSMNGYALEAMSVKLQNGEAMEMEDFILGRGKVSVKGQILSAMNNQAIENATIFFLYDPQYEKFYSGNDISSSNGHYQIIGLEKPGIFDVTILHKDHQILKTKVNLKLGENNFDFKLEPKKKSENVVKSFPFSEATNKYKSTTLECGCDTNDIMDSQEKMCDKLDEKKNCIKDPISLDCMTYKCDEGFYTIICKNDCPTKKVNGIEYIECAYTSFGGAGKEGDCLIHVCLNHKERCNFTNKILHEIVHICDRRGGPREYPKDCIESRAYETMYCIFGEYNDAILWLLYLQRCLKYRKKGK
jgi:hypothetical protein